MTVKRVRESFVSWDEKGMPTNFSVGQLVDSDKTAAYKGRESLFEDIDVYMDRSEDKTKEYPYAPAKDTAKPESATAEPGEKRSLPTPKTDSPVTRFQPPAKETK